MCRSFFGICSEVSLSHVSPRCQRHATGHRAKSCKDLSTGAVAGVSWLEFRASTHVGGNLSCSVLMYQKSHFYHFYQLGKRQSLQLQADHAAWIGSVTESVEVLRRREIQWMPCREDYNQGIMSRNFTSCHQRVTASEVDVTWPLNK